MRVLKCIGLILALAMLIVYGATFLKIIYLVWQL